jgi:vacuolar-type H+-ATPase subunit E/Vma4
MTDRDSAQVLRDEILSEARRESQEILDRARRDAETLLAQATSQADKIRLERLEQARLEAARRKDLLLATVPVEAGRLRSTRIEELLNGIHETVSQRLTSRKGFNYRESVIVLAADAVDRMSGETFTVRLSQDNRDILGEKPAEEIARRVGRAPVKIIISYDSRITDGGPIIEDGEIRQIWDNRLSVRLERLWPELRRHIALEASLVATTEKTGENP